MRLLLLAVLFTSSACGVAAEEEPLAEAEQAATTPPPACASYLWYWGTCTSQRPVQGPLGQQWCQVYKWSVTRYSNGYKTVPLSTTNYGGTCSWSSSCPQPSCS